VSEFIQPDSQNLVR